MQRFTNYKSKLVHHLDVLVAIRDGVVSPPVNVEIDLSNRCSLACTGCHFAHTHSRGPFSVMMKGRHQVSVGDLMDTGLAMNLVHELAELGTRSITWTGGGEPTLHPDFQHITSATAATSLQQGLYTNGVHVTPEMASSLGESLEWAYISMDCPDAESYRKWKKVDAFEAAREGARLLGLAVSVVGMGFLLHGKNYHLADKMLQLGKKCGVDYVQFRPLVDFEFATPGVRKGNVDWIARFLETFVPPEDIAVELDRDRFTAYANWESHGYNECLWSAVQTVVTPDGHVWTCVNKRGEPDCCLGDLNNLTFQDIWRSRPIACVNAQCRVMCRGHLPNQFMHWVFRRRPHSDFP